MTTYTPANYDVVIIGGGLAGLTLALQLRQQQPQLSIAVVERQQHPVAQSAHKVGESSVEIGAHYFDTVLGLKQHMQEKQLKKFGFRFFFNDQREDIDQVLELGASRYLYTPSYQIDRGIFENYLATTCSERGVHFMDGASVHELEIGTNDAAHTVHFERAKQRQTLHCRWLLDASGRAGLLKNQLGLAEKNAHDANAVWFRIDTRIDVDQWSNDSAWLQRCDPPLRWLSTNHLCGEGYWVWLIPLSSGSHSVGIVCDAKTHPLRTMNSYARVLQWFEKHQPRLARELAGKESLLQDFYALRHFSYGCKQVFSADRWALTGEAGLFLDPFYSPGSDFIAISNTYICELIRRDLNGESFGAHAQIFQEFYFSFYRSTLTLYQDQYGLFGDPEVMPIKVIWDYSYYWGILCQLFFQHQLTNITLLSRVRNELNATLQLNDAMQRLLRAWSGMSSKMNTTTMLDQANLQWFAELNKGLRDALSETQFIERLKENTVLLQTLAGQIVQHAQELAPGLDTSEIAHLVGISQRNFPSMLFAARTSAAA
jgi:flavin-dependent dehydrogenase